MSGLGVRSRAVVLATAILFEASAATAQEGARPGWLTRTPIARTFDALDATDAETRRAAAERLATVGSHDRVMAALGAAIPHESVPEVFATMVRTLARRAEPGDSEALSVGWDRATTVERQLVLAAWAEIDDEAAREALERTVHEGLGAACDALVGSEERLRWLSARPIDPPIVLCLAQAAPSDARNALLVRAASEAEPGVVRAILAALARSPAPSPDAVALARRALEGDPSVAPLAHEILSRGDPARLSPTSWVGLLATESRASALRALLALAPERADEALATERALGGEDARGALEIVLERERAEDLPRIASFLRVDATRDRALDALTVRPGGDLVLAAEPPAPDRDIALALARPRAEARDALLGQHPSLLVRALLGGATPEGCAPDPSAAVLERRAAAACLALLPEGGRTAARALESEREPSVVAWLALAARGRPRRVRPSRRCSTRRTPPPPRSRASRRACPRWGPPFDATSRPSWCTWLARVRRARASRRSAPSGPWRGRSMRPSSSGRSKIRRRSSVSRRPARCRRWASTCSTTRARADECGWRRTRGSCPPCAPSPSGPRRTRSTCASSLTIRRSRRSHAWRSSSRAVRASSSRPSTASSCSATCPMRWLGSSSASARVDRAPGDRSDQTCSRARD